MIIKINQSWNNFALENRVEKAIKWIGQDYLEICKKITGLSNIDAKRACGSIDRFVKIKSNEHNSSTKGILHRSPMDLWKRCPPKVVLLSVTSQGTKN